MQITKNLKHIFFVFLCVFLMILFLVFSGGSDIRVGADHRIIYRDGTGSLWIDKIYPYHFRPSRDIVIVKIDNESLNVIQSKQANIVDLNLSKSIYENLVKQLELGGAKGIAFDIVFQNKDISEESFAQELTHHSNIVLARQIDPGKCYKDEDGKYETCNGLPRSVYSGTKYGFINVFQNSDIGHTQDVKQSNAVDRRYSIFRTASGEVLETLPLALYHTHMDTGPIPYEENTVTFQPFFGPPESYASISLHKVLDMSKVELISNFGGKYVFVGEAGTMLADTQITPVTNQLMNGVEFHAHYLDGILQGRYLTYLSFLTINNGGLYYTIFFCLFLLINIIAYLQLPKFIAPFFTVTAFVSVIWMVRYGYYQYGFVTDTLPILLATVPTYFITYTYRFFFVDREKRIITSAFSHYVDPRVVSRIGENADRIELGGETKNLSVLFSDIAGFTTLSERLLPSDLFYLMSGYLSRMTDILTREGGTLDKYIGDAVMGFFGAPLPMEDHAYHACATALAMRASLPVYNNELLARGLEPIDFRIGIASGDVLVGNIGSQERFNYTVLGDVVNLASRLEGASKEYGTHILISAGTYEGVKDKFFFRRVDRIAVKGKSEGVDIYELVSSLDTKYQQNLSLFARYEEALLLYFSGQYLRAGQIWESFAHEDTPSKVMAHRCLALLRGTLKIESGVYVMDHK